MGNKVIGSFFGILAYLLMVYLIIIVPVRFHYSASKANKARGDCMLIIPHEIVDGFIGRSRMFETEIEYFLQFRGEYSGTFESCILTRKVTEGEYSRIMYDHEEY